MRYRRDYTQGASYFFTVVTFRRVQFLTTEAAVNQLRQAFKDEITRRPFVIDAIVILPDHIHSIWTLPKDDADYSIPFVGEISSGCLPNRLHPMTAPPYLPVVAIKENRRYGNGDFGSIGFVTTKITAIMSITFHNPVKHGYIKRPADWAYSSIHRYIRQGVLPATWGSDVIVTPDGVGHE